MESKARNVYPMSSFIMGAGAIGSLQTLKTIPVIAGDSLSIDLKSVFRLSPLRRNLYLDAQVDLFAFYVPYRHVYGADWTNFMLSGKDEAITLTTRTITNGVYCLGEQVNSSGVVPAWLTDGYLQIWNRYFRAPTDDAAIKAMTYFDSIGLLTDEALYGLGCCYLKRTWNSGIDQEVVAGDYELDLTAGSDVDIIAFAQKQGLLETQREREWFGQRYTDLLGSIYGGSASTDGDQRPTLLMRNKGMLSGYDIDVTDTEGAGNYSGKAQSVGHMFMPMRYMPEHGTVWIMALVRFPSVHVGEKSYLVTKSQPTYTEIAGDPAVMANEPPMALIASDWLAGSPATNCGIIPHGQWYRELPNAVHFKYAEVQGHPFVDNDINTKALSRYTLGADYDDKFQTLALKHWNSQGHLQVIKKTCIPDIRSSIYAGTRKS